MKNRGFTLIELMIVVVIVGILCGLVISIINVSSIRRKANETVLKSNLSRVCLAWMVCKVSPKDTASIACDTESKLNAVLPTTPQNSVYTFNNNRWEGTIDTCTYACNEINGAIMQAGDCVLPN